VSNHYDLNNVMARLPLLQKAALAAMESPVGADAVSYWPYQQEAPPYVWNRIEGMVVTELSGDIEIHTYQVAMALVIAHITQGYKGQTSQAAYGYIAAVLDHFRAHKDLVIANEMEYNEPPEFLWIERGGAMITAIPNGTRTLANSGIGVSQVAIVFTLDVPLVWRVY
jgi:hypothetical protein